jgi:hypothetical protein
MKNRILPSLFLSFVLTLILLLSPIVSASSATFTTTADFDSGTKSQPGSPDGNYQVETVTNNPVIAAGSIELASMKGDDFGFADADANTFKWAVTDFINAGSGAQHDISTTEAGKLHLRIVTGTITQSWAGVSLKAQVSGNLDVQIGSITPHKEDASVGVWLNLLNENVAACDIGASATVDGVVYENRWTGTERRTNAYSCTNGVITQIGSTSSLSDVDYFIRITRSGTTVTWYYSTDGSSWTQDETTTFTTSSSLFVGISASGNSGNRVSHWDVNSFSLVSGTLAAGGYRTSGNWLSASQTATSQTFQSIVVNYSGASGANFITAISLIDGAGTYKFIDNTDLISGTTHTYTMSLSMSGAWKLRINFTGDNSGSVNVQEIVVTANTVCQLGTLGLTLDMLIPILVGASLVVFALGFIFIGLESKHHAKKGLSLELLIGAAIGITVAIAVAAGVIASMKVC